MAVDRKPYGLVVSDDGKRCYTIWPYHAKRWFWMIFEVGDWDGNTYPTTVTHKVGSPTGAPLPGVVGFAVEEATENTSYD
ncbi:MAG: hypothetical protein DRN95_08995, partial [Candidatus Hydrothermarchaeota archaeon]